MSMALSDVTAGPIFLFIAGPLLAMVIVPCENGIPSISKLHKVPNVRSYSQLLYFESVVPRSVQERGY